MNEKNATLNACLDVSFGNNGWITTVFSGRCGHPNAIAILPSGKILVAGPFATNEPFHKATVTGSSFAPARYQGVKGLQ